MSIVQYTQSSSPQKVASVDVLQYFASVIRMVIPTSCLGLLENILWQQVLPIFSRLHYSVLTSVEVCSNILEYRRLFENGTK